MNEWKTIPGVHNTQELYQFLAQRYILEITRIDRIDKRMQEYEIPFIPCPPEKMDDYQAHDFMELQYIYMRNDVHLERLTQQQMEILEEAKDNLTEEERIVNAMKLVQDTYREVLAFSEVPDIDVELFSSISGEGIVPGGAIVFMLAAVPDYDDAGNIKDWDKEHRKDNVLLSLKAQLEPACERMLKMPVRFIIV